jgi:hypothetical protein
MRLLALVKAQPSIERFLRHLGLPTAPPPRAPARGPPFWRPTVLRRHQHEHAQREMFDSYRPASKGRSSGASTPGRFGRGAARSRCPDDLHVTHVNPGRGPLQSEPKVSTETPMAFRMET